MNKILKNFFSTALDYSVMTTDIFGCMLRTQAGNNFLEDIVCIDPEKFKPMGLDALTGYDKINEQPKEGERGGAGVGLIAGLSIDLLSCGIVPLTLLAYDTFRSFALYNRKPN